MPKDGFWTVSSIGPRDRYWEIMTNESNEKIMRLYFDDKGQVLIKKGDGTLLSNYLGKWSNGRVSFSTFEQKSADLMEMVKYEFSIDNENQLTGQAELSIDYAGDFKVRKQQVRATLKRAL